MRLLAGGRGGRWARPEQRRGRGTPQARPPTGPAQPQLGAEALGAHSRPVLRLSAAAFPCRPVPGRPALPSLCCPLRSARGLAGGSGLRSLRQHRPHKQLLQEAGPDLTAKSSWGLPSRVSAVAKLPQGLLSPR